MKREQTLLQTDEVRVRVMHLQPGEATHWHFHKEITDHLVSLSGVILVRLRQPESTSELQPGGRLEVEAGRVHQVANGSPSQPASYLLVQGVGRYDFNVVDAPPG